MAHDVIPDVFKAQNETLVQWVGETDWVYATEFATPEGLGDSKAVIAFDGLDTYATVTVNGEEVLKTENMFVPERVDVTNFLRGAGKNKLTITFKSTWLEGKKLMEKHPEHKWGCWNGDPSRLSVRKAQYHYGWDWGPTLMTCGPWRPINLEFYSARISDAYQQQSFSESYDHVKVTAKAEVEGSASDVKFELFLHGKLVGSKTTPITGESATAVLEVSKPELWYPSGYGSQPLYTLKTTLLEGQKELDVVNKKIGLRTAKVIQRKLKDAPGESFFFEINGTPIFCGGSDWIPADSFIPQISADRYRDWVKLAVDGRQVMIRVWAGGIFEEEAFYDACDEMGIMIWQDFLFGCGNYPAYPEFLKQVDREARANIKIMRHHPSIVLWAGNNEDYQYQESEKLTYDPSDKDPQSWLKTDFPARYIYEKVLPDAVADLSPDTFYHPGSPWGQYKHTTDQTVGDLHQWNVWHGYQERYQNWDKLMGRFVSEFGMEAFPSVKTIDAFLPDDPNERHPQSATIDFHNKADGHERRMALYLVENIRYSPSPLEQFVYSTQLMQSECLASAYRLWRRYWKGPGREYCAGALVWQLNDCWPVTSWAIVDYYLRPKHAYYAIKRELAPISVGLKRVVSSTPEDKYTRTHIKTVHKVEVWGSNLTLANATVDVHLKAFDVATGKVIATETLKTGLELTANQSTEAGEWTFPIPLDDKRNRDKEIVVAAYLLQGGKQVARVVDWPQPLKHASVSKPKKLEVQPGDGFVAVSAEVPVKGLVLECDDEDVKWEDNCVDLVPDEVVKIGVKGLKAGPGKDISVRYYGML